MLRTLEHYVVLSMCTAISLGLFIVLGLVTFARRGGRLGATNTPVSPGAGPWGEGHSGANRRTSSPQEGMP